MQDKDIPSGRVPGSREPDPSCTGSVPAGFDPARTIVGMLRSGPAAYIYWECSCGWTSSGYDPAYPQARRSAHNDWLAHMACAHGAMATGTAETVEQGSVHEGAGLKGIAQTKGGDTI